MNTSGDSNKNITVVGEKSFKLSRPLKLVIIVLILGILAGGGYYYYKSLQNKKSSEWAPYAQQDYSQYKNANSRGIALQNEGKYEEALALYDQKITEVTDNKVKALLVLNKSLVYFNQQNFDKALELAFQSESLDKNYSVEKYIAEIYTMKGDKGKAIEHYQKSIDYNDPKSETFAADNELSNMMISELSK